MHGDQPILAYGRIVGSHDDNGRFTCTLLSGDDAARIMTS